jgi:ABC-2 type transport system permease protein
LTRLDYFLGKLGVIAVLVAAVAVLPAVAAYICGVCFSLDFGVIRDTWRILPASILYGLIIVASAGTLMLALSSMSRRSLYVGIAWIGLWIISSAVAGVLTGIQQQVIYHTAWQEERNRENSAESIPEQPPDPDQQFSNRASQPMRSMRSRVQERVDKEMAETAPTNWRPLFSYTANLQRLGEVLLNDDAAWVEIGRAIEAPRAVLQPFLGRVGPGTVPPINERRLANQLVMQYPWTWSAGILAGVFGISIWIMITRVKSLDRLK